MYGTYCYVRLDSLHKAKSGHLRSLVLIGINVTRWIVITYLIHPAKSFVPFFFHSSS